jgi:hypothetical protein
MEILKFADDLYMEILKFADDLYMEILKNKTLKDILVEIKKHEG